MCVDEFLHYAGRANGSVHLLVPGKLVFFCSPEDLGAAPDQPGWIDDTNSTGALTRRFGPGYYADLFQEMGVAVVASLTSSDFCPAAFDARGIEVVDLHLGCAAVHSGAPPLMQAMDQLVCLSRAVGDGLVAVHSGEAMVWPDYLGNVVSAYLIHVARFSPRGAVAWVLLFCPWMFQDGVAE